MSLQQVYESFLAAPSVDTLAKDAVLNYVTTTVTFAESAQIIKHLELQRKVLRKKSEKALNAIADRHALFLEVETVIEFVNGGGSYLPGLDDNFLTDQIVMVPIVWCQSSPGNSITDFLNSNMLFTSIRKAKSNRFVCIGTRARC